MQVSQFPSLLLLILFGLVLALGSCVTGTSAEKSFLQRVAKHVECPKDKITIQAIGEARNEDMPVEFMASGCQRVWKCNFSQTDSAFDSRQTEDCQETEESERGTFLMPAMQQVFMLTNCSVSDMKASKTEWSRWGQRAYRIDACGKMFLCVSRVGKASCKPAAE